MTTTRGISELERVQRWMLAVITHPDGIDEGAGAADARQWIEPGAGLLDSVVTRSRQLTAREGLAVYGNAYYARLLECLGEVYPVLKRTLGDDSFDSFAFVYLQTCPSRSYTLHELGRQFPGYLKETRPPSENDGGGKDWADFLVDLATLEWVIYEVFDGPGLEDADKCVRAPFFEKNAENWLGMKFRMAPCLRLLEFRFPVNDHYTAVRATEEGLHLDFPEPGRYFMAVSRRGYVVRRYPLTEAQFVLLTGLREGQTLGEALMRLLDSGERPEEAGLQESLPRWFRRWAAERCFFDGLDLIAASA